jgi:L-iditol 2-dehydrogenase
MNKLRKKMVKAVTLVGPKKIEIREYPLPEVSNGSILVKMIMSGICGTDKNSYK